VTKKELQLLRYKGGGGGVTSLGVGMGGGRKRLLGHTRGAQKWGGVVWGGGEREGVTGEGGKTRNQEKTGQGRHKRQQSMSGRGGGKGGSTEKKNQYGGKATEKSCKILANGEGGKVTNVYGKRVKDVKKTKAWGGVIKKRNNKKTSHKWQSKKGPQSIRMGPTRKGDMKLTGPGR